LKDRNGSGGGERAGIIIRITTIRHHEGRGVPKAEVIVIRFVLLVGGAKDGRDRDGFPDGHAGTGGCNLNSRELSQGLGGWKNKKQGEYHAPNRETAFFFIKKERKRKNGPGSRPMRLKYSLKNRSLVLKRPSKAMFFT
jgi:hypothetical protein